MPDNYSAIGPTTLPWLTPFVSGMVSGMQQPSGIGPSTVPWLTPMVSQTLGGLQQMGAMGAPAQGAGAAGGGGGAGLLGFLQKAGSFASSALSAGAPALALAPAAFQGALGLAQLALTAILPKARRPTYHIPQPILANAAMARDQYLGRAAPYRIAEQNILAQQGNAIAQVRRNVGSAAQAASLVGGIQANTNTALRGLGQAEAADRMSRASFLANQRGILAQYQDKAFELNEMQPYRDRAAMHAALREAALRNLYGATKSIGGTGQNLMAFNYIQGAGINALGSTTQNGYSVPWWMFKMGG